MPDTFTSEDDAATKARILDALRGLAESRPGIDPRDYITRPDDDAGRRAYRADARRVTRDLRDARALLRAVELAGVTGAVLTRAVADESRLEWGGGARRLGLDYIAGQHYATEYRAAVCRAAARALWQHYAGPTIGQPGTADRVARTMRNVLGRGLAARWGR